MASFEREYGFIREWKLAVYKLNESRTKWLPAFVSLLWEKTLLNKHHDKAVVKKPYLAATRLVLHERLETQCLVRPKI